MTIEEIKKIADELYPHAQIIDYNATGYDAFVKGAMWMQEQYEIKCKQEETDYLKLFSSLPHLDCAYNIVDDWGYTPSLYHFDTQWFVSWVHCEEGDTLLDYSGQYPEEAIKNAYTHYKEDIENRKKS